MKSEPKSIPMTPVKKPFQGMKPLVLSPRPQFTVNITAAIRKLRDQ